jgi:hypothetical protein
MGDATSLSLSVSNAWFYLFSHVHVFFVLDFLFWHFLLAVAIRSVNGLLTRLRIMQMLMHLVAFQRYMTQKDVQLPASPSKPFAIP